MRDPIQTARDRQTLEKFPESEAWAALARGIRERIALHTETLLLSTPREPDEAFALVHRQQALVRELEQLVEDPLEWLFPVTEVPAEAEETADAQRAQRRRRR